MADSNITKRALAAVLKELMKEQPFQKVSVSDICERCGMSRKSFYYHFKDKYDLVNWIFDSEYLLSIRDYDGDSVLDLFGAMCHYLYDNRAFYRHALKIEGQNSFIDHFRDTLRMSLRSKFIRLMGEYEDFQLDFYSDAIICAIERWLTSKKCVPPDEFLKMLMSCAHSFEKFTESSFISKTE